MGNENLKNNLDDAQQNDVQSEVKAGSGELPETFVTLHSTTESVPLEAKTLGNTDANKASKNVKDIVFWGNGDTFKLLSKASSKQEGWMKSTKAMEIPGVGCVVQMTTQQGNNVAEAGVFVPGTIIQEIEESGEVVGRVLVKAPKRP